MNTCKSKSQKTPLYAAKQRTHRGNPTSFPKPNYKLLIIPKMQICACSSLIVNTSSAKSILDANWL